MVTPIDLRIHFSPISYTYVYEDSLIRFQILIQMTKKQEVSEYWVLLSTYQFRRFSLDAHVCIQDGTRC